MKEPATKRRSDEATTGSRAAAFCLRRRVAASPRAFTLVELIVAIALVVILMYGVTKVFTTTQGVVSANQAISNATRDARAAQSVMAQDFARIATDGPFLYIHSERVAAFRNRADMEGDRDYNATLGDVPRDLATRTTDVDGDNQETPGTIDESRFDQISGRNHRLDQLTFFARGLFKRQTGGTPPNGASPFIANMSAADAMIHYGHMRIADNNGTVALASQDPGTLTLAANPNNFFATDWVLGREAILLKEGPNIVDNSGAAQIFIHNTAGTNLTPLAAGTGTDFPGGVRIEDSRYDLAATSIGAYRQKLKAYIDANPGTDWWDSMVGTSRHRFQSDPAVRTKPITPAIFSQQAPIFMRGCTQFIVEYAGDFLKQNLDPTNTNYGLVTGVYKTLAATPPAATDGVIDFIRVPSANGGPPYSKRIRWYGMPRYVNGTVVAGQPRIPGYASAATTANDLTEVVPLRDVWMTIGGGEAAANAGAGAPFERNILVPGSGIPMAADYMTSLPREGSYNCAWGPNDAVRPKLIRITFTIDDPQGRTPDGQTYEYIFEVP